MPTLLLLILSTWLTSCARPCAKADVATVIEACKVAPAGGPRYDACFLAGLRPPQTFDIVGTAVETCSANGSGALFECLAAKASTCRAHGVDAALDECHAAAGGPGMNAPAQDGSQQDDCMHVCISRQTSCAKQCATTSWEECAACAEGCGRDVHQCFVRC